MSLLSGLKYTTKNFSNSIYNKTLGFNKEKKSEVDIYSYQYAFDVARKPVSVLELRGEILKSTEIISRIYTIIDDVIPGYEIICEDDNLKKRVETILEEISFFTTLQSSYFDYMISGDGYLEPVFVRDKDVDTILSHLFKIDTYKDMFHEQDDSRLIKEMALKQNPELYDPTNIYWVLADNMYKKYNTKGEIIGYKQIIHGQITTEWEPEQIANLSAFKTQSEIYGFTPLLAYLDDLVILKDTKLYIKNYFENNGMPDFILSLEEAKGPNDPAYKKLKELMKERREKQTRGSLVSSGKLFVQALNNVRDMDFENLLNYLGSNLDKLWRIPPQKLGGTSSKTRDANSVLAPYFARIKKEQKIFEDLLNSKIFSHFGGTLGQVKIKLSNSSAIDQVKDVTWTSLMYNDGALSLSEYREAMGKSRDAPTDLKDNPHFMTKEEMVKLGEQQMQAGAQPNNGKAADNKANPNKTPKQKAKEQ